MKYVINVEINCKINFCICSQFEHTGSQQVTTTTPELIHKDRRLSMLHYYEYIQAF